MGSTLWLRVNLIGQKSCDQQIIHIAGYTGLYKRRTGSYSDGCAVFYKEAKLKLLEWKGLEYQRRVNVLNRDNVAVLAKFSLIEKGYVH